jgi:GT2 family glycosyltransferase
VRYVFNGANLGFGKGHNLAFATLAENSQFHLVLNPDICFDKEVIPHLMSVLLNDDGIGVVMPRINYPSGNLQRLCKLLPTPIDLIGRRFIPFKALLDRINSRYELYSLTQDFPVDVPCLSGCFLFLRSALLRQIGGFDERFFMYLEDVDLVRRVGSTARVVYDPRVSVVHSYAKGSYRNRKLLIYHVRSAFQYFGKWGWFFDQERKNRNQDVLRRLQLGE